MTRKKKDSTPSENITPVVSHAIEVKPLTAVSVPVTSVVTTTQKLPPILPKLQSIFVSRKFLYATAGVAVSLFTFLVAVEMVCKNPLVAPSLVSLFNTELSFIGGVVATMLGVHTWMDWSNVQQNATNVISTVESKTDVAKIFTYNYSDAQRTENVSASRTKNSSC